MAARITWTLCRSNPMLRMITILGLLLLASSCVAQDESSNSPISYSDVQSRGVVGQLGLKLGTVANVSGTIISGSELRTKEADGRYFLKISHVDGKRLDSTVVLAYRIPSWANVKLLPIAGKSVELKVFEEGEFSGLPNGLDPMDQWAAPMFHFSTHLTILNDLRAKSNSPTPGSLLSYIVAIGVIALALTFAYFLIYKRMAKNAT